MLPIKIEIVEVQRHNKVWRMKQGVHAIQYTTIHKVYLFNLEYIIDELSSNNSYNIFITMLW